MTSIRRHFEQVVLRLHFFAIAAAQNISASLNGVITDENGDGDRESRRHVDIDQHRNRK